MGGGLKEKIAAQGHPNIALRDVKTLSFLLKNRNIKNDESRGIEEEKRDKEIERGSGQKKYRRRTNVKKQEEQEER